MFLKYPSAMSLLILCFGYINRERTPLPSSDCTDMRSLGIDDFSPKVLTHDRVNIGNSSQSCSFVNHSSWYISFTSAIDRFTSATISARKVLSIT